jgi:hypothetical protein
VVEDRDPAPLEIGATLKQARKRLGLEIRAVEDQTKIRIKYLRALEDEEWDVLPAATYVRGFLRAYAEVLGIDGEVLADEYRRRFEDPADEAHAMGEPVLAERHRRQREPMRPLAERRGPLLAAVAAVIVLLIVILAITGGTDDGETGPSDSVAPTVEADAGDGERPDRAPRRPVGLTIVTETDVEVCALDADDQPLIDGQLLLAGTEEDLGRSRRYEIDLGAGVVELVVDGTADRIELDAPATFRVTSTGVREVTYTGPGCP